MWLESLNGIQVSDRQPYITIAGQTAPGGGVTLANYPTIITATDVILRHLRFRLGDAAGQQEDALEIKGTM